MRFPRSIDRIPASSARLTARAVYACAHTYRLTAGLVHHRAQLVHRVLHGVDPVGRRGDTAGGHHLDVMAALAQLVAGRGAHRVNPVGDP